MGRHAKIRKNEVSERKKKSRDRFLIAIPLIALVIKLITMANTPGGGWLGADGENYLTGVDGLLKDGFFSKEGKLIYWPAGYPIFIWPLAALSMTKFIYFLSVIQSLFFAIATYFFTREIVNTKIAPLAVIISFFISFNPTLSLSTLAVGYEALVAALLMIAITYIIKDLNSPSLSLKWTNILIVNIVLTISVFFQPRIILISIIYLFYWTFQKSGNKLRIQFATISLIILMILPSILIIRNLIANDRATISTNLGVTMRIGAGDEATGGYGVPKTPVSCSPDIEGQEVSDNRLVLCVLQWYAANPSKTGKLALNKSRFYWSPWFGPEANGTMARNPWLKISPLVGISQNQEGRDLIYGTFGKVISWLWLLGGIALVGIGLYWLWLIGGVERKISALAGIPVISGWLISLGTIGDHRFRIPQMGLSLFLQIVGFYGLGRMFKRSSKPSF